ncbi:MAG: type I-E CRISPR-associated protein Cse1/CasA, partial [Chloroflexota bacterium]
MRYTFNLIDVPWILCVTGTGEQIEVGLRDLLLNAHNLKAISCETPLMTAAIMPMTLALLHRVFGPHDETAWKELWSAGRFPAEPLEAYFAQWYDRFDLFHPERPFYQVWDDRVQPKSVIHL